jgi:adenosine kinase
LRFRYHLKANDAILATDEHKGLNETLLLDHPNHQFVAGGATQNTMRAATVILSISKLNLLSLFF